MPIIFVGYIPFFLGPILVGLWWGWFAGGGVFAGNILLCWLIGVYQNEGRIANIIEGNPACFAYPILVGIATLVVVLAVHSLLI